MNRSLVEDDDPVCHFKGLLLIVGDEDACEVSLLVELGQPATQLPAYLGVESAEGLIEEQDPRLDCKGPCKRYTLALPARELRWEAISEAGKLDGFQQ